MLMRMSAPSKCLRGLVLAATTIAGLAAGHTLDYALLVPNPADRQELLSRTGHGHLTTLMTMAVIAAVVAAGISIVLGISRSRGVASKPLSIRLAIPFAMTQVGAFVSMEFAERLISGVPLHHLNDRIIFAGIVVQVLVGLVAALIVILLERAGVGIGMLLRRRSPQRATSSFAARRVTLPRLRSLRPCPIRGPPCLLLD